MTFGVIGMTGYQECKGVGVFHGFMLTEKKAQYNDWALIYLCAYLSIIGCR